jgi:hypothetical protein
MDIIIVPWYSISRITHLTEGSTPMKHVFVLAVMLFTVNAVAQTARATPPNVHDMLVYVSQGQRSGELMGWRLLFTPTSPALHGHNTKARTWVVTARQKNTSFCYGVGVIIVRNDIKFSPGVSAPIKTIHATPPQVCGSDFAPTFSEWLRSN